MKLLELATLSACVMLAGCGALFNSSPQPVTFTSAPAGAAVWVNNVPRGQTPVILNLPKNENHTVVFKMDGYQDFGAPINKKISAGYVVLDILGGIVPVIIDAATGSWYKLEVNTIHGALARNPGDALGEPAGRLTPIQLSQIKAGRKLDDVLGFTLVGNQ